MNADAVIQTVENLCRKGKRASRVLAGIDDELRSHALSAAAARLRTAVDEIGRANQADLADAQRAGLAEAMLDRLRLTPERVGAMAAGMEQVASLADPLRECIAEWTAPSGLHIRQIRIPIGLIGVIYESRPNVTADVAALCLKSGNAVVLKGGKESLRSNSTLADLLGESFAEEGIPDGAVELIRSTDRRATWTLLAQRGVVDMVIPRGGPRLQQAVAEHAKVPVINHFDGICQVYVDRAADLAMAEKIVFTGKVGRPGVCNAVEKLVVHRDIAEVFLAKLGPRLHDAGVEVRADHRGLAYLPAAKPASDEDMRTEFLDLILAVKTVDSLDEAINFINDNGSGHSDSIVTRDEQAAERFLAAVDSAVVYHNASTRFTDGFEFGFGAEIGISTNRIHARGPMGLRALTTYKYVVHGDGQVR